MFGNWFDKMTEMKILQLRLSTLHLKFLNSCLHSEGVSAINSPEQYMRLVWGSGRSPNLLASSYPSTPQESLLLLKLRPCKQNPILAEEMCQLTILDGVIFF